jgi:hypothetical protein
MSCAAALEPRPSMNSPITADAARPPISFTTGVIAFVLADSPAGGAHREALACLQRGLPVLPEPAV